MESEVGAVAEFMTRGLVGGKDHEDSFNELIPRTFLRKLEKISIEEEEGHDRLKTRQSSPGYLKG